MLSLGLNPYVVTMERQGAGMPADQVALEHRVSQAALELVLELE